MTFESRQSLADSQDRRLDETFKGVDTEGVHVEPEGGKTPEGDDYTFQHCQSGKLEASPNGEVRT